MRFVQGRDGAGARAAVALVDGKTAVANPAFDVTPARLVTGIVTERGVAKPGELAALFEPFSVVRSPLPVDQTREPTTPVNER